MERVNHSVNSMRWRLVRRPVQTVLTLALLGAAVGCSSKGNVSGKVTFQGKHLPGGTVSFAPEGGGPGGSSEINPKDGTYSVVGLPTGAMKITVQPFRGRSAPPNMPGGASYGPPKDAKDVDPEIFKRGMQNPEGAEFVDIPFKYTTPDATDLRYTVTGGAQEFNIDLKGP